MSWAAKRRLIILLIVGAVLVAFAAVVFIATFTKAPSCADTIQNQGEDGIDCGGPCAYLCSALMQPPTILFAKAISNTPGRTDVIAMVENKNATAAAKGVPYRVQLYGADRALIQEVTGTLDLPPGTTQPVFIPGIASGKQVTANAFLIIDSSTVQWVTMNTDPRIKPSVSNTRQGGTIDAPRIEATLTNRSVMPLTNVPVIVLVRSEKGSVIAASSTLLPVIPAQGVSTAFFTWNSAFSSVPASIEVAPIIPLP